MPASCQFDLEYFAKGGYGKGKPLLGIGEGDCCLYFDVLDSEDEANVFEELRDEVQWGRMRNRDKDVQRLVAIQGTIDEHPESGNKREPLYRHPADEQPALCHWTPAVDKIRTAIMKDVPDQQLNHCLIQQYRSPTDSISEHADKTLDIELGSNNLNYSSGATRVMTLRTKKTKTGENNNIIIQKVTLPHNSVFVLGWKTNSLWKHAIKPDKRMARFKREDELRNEGQRISLTFRQVSSYCRHSDFKVYGQGGKYKTEQELDESIANGTFPEEDEAEESVRLLKCFAHENHSATFSWDDCYGEGFNILNFKVLLNEQTK